MQGNVVIQQLPVVCQSDKWLAKGGKAEDYFMKAEVTGVKNRIKGKYGNKQKAREQQREGKCSFTCINGQVHR